MRIVRPHLSRMEILYCLQIPVCMRFTNALQLLLLNCPVIMTGINSRGLSAHTFFLFRPDYETKALRKGRFTSLP